MRPSPRKSRADQNEFTAFIFMRGAKLLGQIVDDFVHLLSTASCQRDKRCVQWTPAKNTWYEKVHLKLILIFSFLVSAHATNESMWQMYHALHCYSIKSVVVNKRQTTAHNNIYSKKLRQTNRQINWLIMCTHCSRLKRVGRTHIFCAAQLFPVFVQK